MFVFYSNLKLQASKEFITSFMVYLFELHEDKNNVSQLCSRMGGLKLLTIKPGFWVIVNRNGLWLIGAEMELIRWVLGG